MVKIELQWALKQRYKVPAKDETNLDVLISWSKNYVDYWNNQNPTIDKISQAFNLTRDQSVKIVQAASLQEIQTWFQTQLTPAQVAYYTTYLRALSDAQFAAAKENNLNVLKNGIILAAALVTGSALAGAGAAGAATQETNLSLPDLGISLPDAIKNINPQQIVTDVKNLQNSLTAPKTETTTQPIQSSAVTVEKTKENNNIFLIVLAGLAAVLFSIF